MIKYNSQVDIKAIDETKLVKMLKTTKNELKTYGLNDNDIDKIKNNKYGLNLDSDNIEIVLINVSICYYVWYNMLYRRLQEYRNSLKVKFIFAEFTENKQAEENHYDSFLSSMALCVQKYGESVLKEISQ